MKDKTIPRRKEPGGEENKTQESNGQKYGQSLAQQPQLGASKGSGQPTHPCHPRRTQRDTQGKPQGLLPIPRGHRQQTSTPGLPSWDTHRGRISQPLPTPKGHRG